MNSEQMTTQPRSIAGISAVAGCTTRKRFALTLLAPALLGFAMQSKLGAQIIAVPLLPVGVSVDEASTLHKVKVVRSTLAYNCPAIGAWVDVPNATTTFAVPAFHKDLFIARFAAESAYSGAPGYARLRILLNATEMQPAAGTDFAFDSNDGGNEGATSWEGHAMERSGSYSTSLLAANPIIKVQCWNPVGGVFRLDDFHFTVEQLHP